MYACYFVRCDRMHEAQLQYCEYVRRLPFGENGWRLIVLILGRDVMQSGQQSTCRIYNQCE